ncbi:MAG: DNA/RNA non-specific endonuclease [Maribacter sp.]|nr:DNA/RNA non-specific endonuclease [Maribacter sp.]
MNRARNKTIYALLLLICIIGFWLFENFYTPATYSSKDTSIVKTEILEDLLPSSTTGSVVEHEHFTLSYNEPFEQAEWVVYVLKKEQLTYQDRKRPFFLEDPKVKSKSADWRNYRGSGYDRGHLCPAGDRRFSEQAYNETFYTSNISPQDKDFNAGVWNRLELQVRQWAKRYGSVFVVTGGILEDGLQEIGEEDVDVPNYFYKIVVKGPPERLEGIAFLIPSIESQKNLEQFTVPIDSIEKLTGIDFFQKLPDSEEAELEGSVITQGWKFN